MKCAKDARCQYRAALPITEPYRYFGRSVLFVGRKVVREFNEHMWISAHKLFGRLKR